MVDSVLPPPGPGHFPCGSGRTLRAVRVRESSFKCKALESTQSDKGVRLRQVHSPGLKVYIPREDASPLLAPARCLCSPSLSSPSLFLFLFCPGLLGQAAEEGRGKPCLRHPRLNAFHPRPKFQTWLASPESETRSRDLPVPLFFFRKLSGNFSTEMCYKGPSELQTPTCSSQVLY